MSADRREFREAFETLFVAPHASHIWASRRGRSHWVELEGWQDSIAGSLYSIATTDDCEYVYSREDWYYASVNDPPSLRTRLLEWHAGLVAGVEQFVPTTPEEATDLAFMRSLVGGMLELLERACAQERARWRAANRV